jgi:SET and MYND domain-containing protein
MKRAGQCGAQDPQDQWQFGWATPGAGRGVFAVRDIAVGDLTHTADPVVAHPALASLQKVGSTSSSELHFSAVSYFLLCCRV